MKKIVLSVAAVICCRFCCRLRHAEPEPAPKVIRKG